MNLFKRTSLLLALLAVAGTAQAQFSATITGTTDYDFRGVSLSAKDPALQASLDYAFGETGFYVGAWASNIDYGNDVDGDIEVDLYAGYDGAINDDTGWTVGLTWYTYPGSSGPEKIPAYPEVWLGINYKGLELKQWYAVEVDEENDGLYTEANYTFELPQNFSLSLHAGYNYGDVFDKDYLDYAVAVGYDVGNFSLELKYTGTDLSGEFKETGDVFNTEGRVIFSVSTTLPWG